MPLGKANPAGICRLQNFVYKMPVIALVGRPNVGKSTLFNRLTRTRDALVADIPGLTRDRQYGAGRLGDFQYTVIDTGGLADQWADTRFENDESGTGSNRSETTTADDLNGELFTQTLLAIQEADVVLLLVDGRSGITAADEQITRQLRRIEVNVILVVNKIDGVGEEQAKSEFFSLGLDEPYAISASHGRGVQLLLEGVSSYLVEEGLVPDKTTSATVAPHFDEPANPAGTEEIENSTDAPTTDKRADFDRIDIAFIGRPNVGKSTLTNALCGENRVIASDTPGTTRDAIAIPFSRAGRDYTLIDTAGVRKRGKVSDIVEKFSVVKTLAAIERAHVCVYLIDATQGVSEQDLQLLGYTIDRGRALVVAVNKWDALDRTQREDIKDELTRRVTFLSFTRIHFISALKESGLGGMLRSIDRAYKSARVNFSTPELTRLLALATERHQPPMIHGRRIKLRYAHQGGVHPPVIVIHGNQTDRLPRDYQRYLTNFFQKETGLFGTPLQLRLRQSENPYEKKTKKAGKGKNSGKSKVNKKNKLDKNSRAAKKDHHSRK